MKFFLDTADINEIREGATLGVVDGVTTNPSLIAKTGRPVEDVAREICSIVDGPLSLEVLSVTAEEMIEEGQKLAAIHPNVVVKIPMIREGLKALRGLSTKGIAVNVTLVFSPLQALLAAKNGAAYVSPFIGRLDDISADGMNLISDIIEVYDAYGFETEVLIASVRNPMHVLEAAKMGADVATVPLAVLEQMLKHPLTDIGLEKFMADWHRSQQSKS
ncbi:MAG: fructose-6-phosphate aldolase [Acidobacteriota bacterium]|nr:MAG: fructose-6-phosphate aldolase [Acidobacteriota bacterium]